MSILTAILIAIFLFLLWFIWGEIKETPLE